LVTEAIPGERSRRRQRALPLGQVHAAAGRHRYPIPLPMGASTSAHEIIRQYRSVIIWCADLNAMVAYAQLDFEILAAK
jgi:hypothetical protein